MLVLFLIVCNLTVPMGTINGLIFYANIVHVNHAFFFMTPKDIRSEGIPTNVLAVFIAWLNLDLGIETCFYPVAWMPTYKHGCSLPFPFYIWMIVGVIIYLSRHSTTVVKLVGSSAVSGACYSVFLLSYTLNCNTRSLLPFSFTYLQNYHSGWQLTSSMAVRWECPFSPRKAHRLVPDGLGCRSVLHPSIHLC